MKIKNILALTLVTVVFARATSTQAAPQNNSGKQAQQRLMRKKNKKNVEIVAVACPGAPKYSCPNACAEADRAERRRIDPWQDPLLAEQLEAEADRANAACLMQNPSYPFPEERALAQQEMAQVD